MKDDKYLYPGRRRNGIFTFFLLLAVFSGMVASGEFPEILSLKQQTTLRDANLKWRLDNLLPALMERAGIDMWLVINREYNEDPVYLTLVPASAMNARRNSILIFCLDRHKKTVDRFSASYYPFEDLYRGVWADKTRDQFRCLAEFIRKKNPGQIGIDRSEHCGMADGLSHTLYLRLADALGPELVSRLVSAEDLAVGWLETRSPREFEWYESAAAIAHALIREFFSTAAIDPGITTRQGLEWWIRQRINHLGLGCWFFPSIDIIREDTGTADARNPDIIRRGDLLHCDVGIVYLGLCTDMQWNAYVCKPGENDAPAGIRAALKKSLKVAELFMDEFREGRTGLDVVKETMKQVRKTGINALIYSHPVGVHGHGAGPCLEGRPPGEMPADCVFTQHYPLFRNTAYAIEFSVFHRVPEWSNQEIRFGFEETAMFTEAGCRFIDGCQDTLILIK